ncbi:MAG: phosphodiesterase [Betaproteobacteria bacterium]
MSSLIVAQISDLHVTAPGQLLLGRIDTAAALARCVDHIMRLPVLPHAVVASGDLVNEGTVEEYALLRRLLSALTMPVYLMPGNHDDAGTLRTAFPDHRYFPDAGQLRYTVSMEGLRLIMLDSVVAGEDGGALGGAQLEWLERLLASDPGSPAFLFMHHPPFPTGIQYMDEIALDAGDAEALGALASRHRCVRRISCGHVHRAVCVTWHGTTVGICPSSAFQYGVQLRPDAKPVVSEEQPAYQLHYWNGNELVTHTVQIDGPK